MKSKINMLARKQSDDGKDGWLGKLMAALMAMGWMLGLWTPARAAEPSFVGILAFLDEPEVAKELALSAEQQEKLTALLDAREAEALELALQLRNLSPGERAEKLLPFRRESERRGLALLTPEQQKKFQQIRLQKLGLASLAEEDVALALGLTEGQKAEVAKILRDREDRLAVTSKDRAHIVRAETERQLAQLLTQEQKSRWERLLAGTQPGASLAPASTPGTAPAGTTPAPNAQTTPEPSASALSKPELAPGKPSEPAKPELPKPGAELAKPELPKPEAEPAKPESVMEKGEPVPPTPGVAEPAKPSELGKPTESAKPTELSKPAEPSRSAETPKPSEPANPGEPVAKPTEPSKAGEPAKPTELATPARPAKPSEPAKPELPKSGAELAKPEFPRPEAEPAKPGSESVKPGEPIAKPPELSPPTESAKPVGSPLVPLDQVKLRFNFRYQPWKDVLEWFAQQAGLSLIMDDPPKGTFNYTDDKAYTPAEAIDLLNSVLQTKGYVLVRRNRMLMVINLENGIPPLLIDTIPVEELDRRGTYEVVSVLFQLDKLTPEEIEGEVQKMIGPQGSVISLPKSRQLLVTETVGRLRAIRRAIQRAEDPEGIHRQQQLRQVPLQYASPQDVLPVLRQFLDIPPEQAASADGSIRVIADPTGKGLLVSGKEEKINRLLEVLKFLDVPENAAKSDLNQTPQLEVYTVAPADPNSVLAVIQTLLAGSPEARVAIDPKTGNLIALCKPSEHATIRATLEQLQADSRKIEVIHLSRVDPQTAATSLKKLFGIGDTPDPNKPQIEVDTTAKQLLVRATQSQLEQIKLLLEKMGETGGETATGTGRGGNVRTIPITGRAAQDVLQQALEIWPTMHRNRIRVVRPSAVIPTMRPSSEEEPGRPEGTGSSATSGGTGSRPSETPEGLLEQLFGPLGLPDSGSGSTGGALRTRIIRPPAEVGPAGNPSGSPSPAGVSSPGGGPGGTAPKPPFPPQPPGTPGPGAWRPAGTPPSGNSSLPAPSPPQSNPAGGVEKPVPGETAPPSLPKPAGEKTADRWPSSLHRARTPIFLASYTAPSEASEEKSAAESPSASGAKTLQTPPSAEQPPKAPVSEHPVAEQTGPTPSVPPTAEPVPTASPVSSGQTPSSSASGAKPAESSAGSPPTASRSAEEPPVIVVAPGPGGIMIASEDLDALDAFENLLNSLASNQPESNVTVFYLKHAKAEAVADLLERIFGAASSSSGGGAPMGGGRGLLGDIAGAALGDAGGGILGTLLGLGGPGGPPGGLAPTGTIQITPDPRLNALVVQANPKDIEMIEELLKILDQEKGPEPVAVQPKARVIPVVNTAAEDIAELVKEVYSDRLIGGGGAGQRPPTPQEFIQMLRGGGGGGRRSGTGGSQVDIQQKMAIGVDSRNNSIIVVAPDQLFQEVEQLVKQLDAAAAESNQTIRVVNLRNANPASVQQALSALMGGNVQFGRTGTAARARQQQAAGAQQQQPAPQGQMPFMMPGAQGVQGFPQFRQFQGQFGAQGFPFQGGASSRQNRSSRSGR